MDFKMIIVSAPSGAGKTTIVSKAISLDNNFAKACTHTTREPRVQAQEKEGIDYHFVSEKKFLKLKAENEFYETALNYGHWYGTSKEAVQNIIKENKIPILVIDVNGASAIRKLNIGNYLSIFIRPPSFVELEKRLLLRSTEKKGDLISRLNNFDHEMEQMQYFDVVLINDEIDITVNKFLKIIKIFAS